MYGAYLDHVLRFLEIMSNLHKVSLAGAQDFDQTREPMVAYLRQIGGFAVTLELQTTPTRVRFAIEDAPTMTQPQFEAMLIELERHIRDDVKTVLLELVPVGKRYFYSTTFCEDLVEKFPKATAELREAGACYALGRNAAAIFHAVRGAEHGVRALARAAGVRGQIDFKEWGKVIKSIEEKVASCDKWKNGPMKSNALEFYRDTLTDARGLKDDARNIWLHLREDRVADDGEAGKAIRRAYDLLKTCQGRISEGNRRVLPKRSFA